MKYWIELRTSALPITSGSFHGSTQRIDSVDKVVVDEDFASCHAVKIHKMCAEPAENVSNVPASKL